FANPDGSLKAGVNTYAETVEFGPQLEKHLEAFVRERLERLTPGALPAAAGPPEVPADYLRWLRDECATIELLGLEAQQGSLARLSQVYVPLTTRARPQVEQTERLRPDAERPTHDMLLARLSEESLYAPGPPGCGKSTFSRWVAWLAATGSLP